MQRLALSRARGAALIAAVHALEMTFKPSGRISVRRPYIKMVRSVMVKGLEALSYECFMAARAAGVDAVILDRSKSYPGIDWPVSGALQLNRMLQHGLGAQPRCARSRPRWRTWCRPRRDEAPPFFIRSASARLICPGPR